MQDNRIFEFALTAQELGALESVTRMYLASTEKELGEEEMAHIHPDSLVGRTEILYRDIQSAMNANYGGRIKNK